ncbi:hypothetical protein GTY54_19295 [Streptomyces sp. SID625]|nr:hypothetical protein [Streptomyces sp. SID625]
MNDLPPDLPRLRTLETWLALQLDQVRQHISAVEQREQERQRGLDARPPAPDWIIEHSIGAVRKPIAVHVGGCHMTGARTKGIDRETALRALVEGVDACPHCRPDTELGFVDG